MNPRCMLGIELGVPGRRCAMVASGAALFDTACALGFMVFGVGFRVQGLGCWVECGGWGIGLGHALLHHTFPK